MSDRPGPATPVALTQNSPGEVPADFPAGQGGTRGARPAVTGDLLARVREVKEQGLPDFELRAALLELMPRVTGPHGSAVRHPADMQRSTPWHTWSPELLVRRHGLYLGMVERWSRAHPGEVRRYNAPVDSELPGLTDEARRISEEMTWDHATHGDSLWEVGEARHEHRERTGEWLPLSVWRTNEERELVMVERGPVREYPRGDDGEEE